jgi:hypothetical protein
VRLEARDRSSQWSIDSQRVRMRCASIARRRWRGWQVCSAITPPVVVRCGWCEWVVCRRRRRTVTSCHLRLNRRNRLTTVATPRSDTGGIGRTREHDSMRSYVMIRCGVCVFDTKRDAQRAKARSRLCNFQTSQCAVSTTFFRHDVRITRTHKCSGWTMEATHVQVCAEFAGRCDRIELRRMS